MPKEAADITMRVPSALRDDLNDLKGKLRVTTPHEAVRKLIDYRDKAEREKNDNKAYQEQHMIEVGKADKAEFLKLKEELGLRTDAGVLEFLIYCYHANMQLPMGAFETYLKMKKEGK
jgi:hypothetical protein